MSLMTDRTDSLGSPGSVDSENLTDAEENSSQVVETGADDALPVLEAAEEGSSEATRKNAVPAGTIAHQPEYGLGPYPIPWRHPIKSAFWTIRMLFGMASLVFMLAVIAAIPLVNFLALGYLLEVEGRLGRSGRFRDGFPLLNEAPRIGSIALGIYLWLLPLRFLGSAAADAHLIDPGSAADVRLAIAAVAARWVIAVHLVLALARGGSLMCFVRPIKNFRWLIAQLRSGSYLRTAGDHIGDFVKRLQLRHHFWLGIRGFGVGFAWLCLPTFLLAIIQQPNGPQGLLFAVGGILLVLALGWTPFLQARFAVEDRFRTGFQLKKIRRLYRYAPLCWTTAVIILFTLSLPLYLFKILTPPRDALWPITLIFVVSIYPTRVLTGWAYYQATKREAADKLAHWTLRWLGSLLSVSALVVYVFILYFTQFVGEEGKAVLFQHHALLLPVPL